MTLNLGNIRVGSLQSQALLELLVDPQTCGPLLISVTSSLADVLLQDESRAWTAIGWVERASC